MTGKTLQKPWVVCLLAVFCCALWGSAFSFVKIGYSLYRIPEDAPGSQILFAGMRFLLAGLLVVLFGSLLQKKWLRPRRQAWGRVFKLALLQTVLQYFFFYIGLAHTSGVKGSIIVGTNSLLSILAATLLFRQEKLSGRKLLGCLVGLAGVTLANVSGGIGLDMAWNGEGFVLLSVVSYALSSVLIKIYSATEDPVTLSGWQFMAGGLLLMALGGLMGGRVSLAETGGMGQLPEAVGVLLYLAFLSAAAYTLWGILLKYNPVSRVAIYGFSNPVIGVFLSALLLGEAGQAFTLKNLAALGLVCAGILIVNVTGHKRQTEQRRETA
ncbi:MAG: DMT family transporter [Eubacteriales bacterium]|nr:DMT family transporter [Eubacteriales bacterium]